MTGTDYIVEYIQKLSKKQDVTELALGLVFVAIAEEGKKA